MVGDRVGSRGENASASGLDEFLPKNRQKVW